MQLIFLFSFSPSLSFSIIFLSLPADFLFLSFFPLLSCISSLHLSLLSVWQPSRSCRSWTRRRAGHLPTPFFLVPPHLPPRPMPAKWCWLRVLPAGSQSGGYAKRQPIITDRALLPPPAWTRRRRPTVPAKRQLQLRKPEHWTANPSGAASGSATTSAVNDQPGVSELEGQRSSGGAQSRVNTALDTGTGSLNFYFGSSLTFLILNLLMQLNKVHMYLICQSFHITHIDLILIEIYWFVKL